MDYIPDAKEINADMGRKGGFEGIGLFPSNGIRPSIHLVCKRYLLMITCGQEADLVNHTSEAVTKVK